METPIQQTLDDDNDYVPLSIKVIVVWFYLLAMISFSSLLSFDARGFVVNATSFVYGLLALWSAYGLGYKRNIARVTAIVLVGWWFMTWVYLGWQAFILWQETTRVAELYIYLMGKEYTGEIAIALFILATVMQTYTIATLLQPRTRLLFSKPRARESLKQEQA